MGYWQDLLAENPTMINATLNSTGPFRWFLHESLLDDKPLDRMVTELILMRGSQYDGGSAGFSMAAQNDSPFAATGHIIGSAFLGLDLQCARCHDSPYHSTKQQDLYALAAMFGRKPTSVPKTSSVPAAFFESQTRESLIKVSLKPGEAVEGDIAFTRAGKTVAASGASLLEQAEEAGLTPEFGCRMGICFSCTRTKTAGTVRNILTGEESAVPDEEVRICVTAAAGDCHIDL